MEIAALLTEARTALMLGDRAKAKQLTTQALRLDSKHIETWLLLADLVEAPAQKRDCFQRILAIDPANATAKHGINLLDAPVVQPTVQPAAASFELPKSSWFANKPAEEASTQPSGSLIATPALPNHQPSSGIRPLSQARQPSIVELSNMATHGSTTPMNYAPPAQVGYGQANPMPNPNYGQPIQANYGQVQLQYGQVDYPYVEPSGAAKFLKWLVFGTIGLIAICAVIGMLSLLGREVPPTPRVSAQDRTTAMLNDTFKLATNPDFYDQKKQPAMIKNFEQKYATRTSYRYGSLFNGVDDSYDGEDGFGEMAQYIKSSYVTPVTYEVVEESATKITLRITKGNFVIVYNDDSFEEVPLEVAFSSFTWVNEDGVWYIYDIEELE